MGALSPLYTLFQIYPLLPVGGMNLDLGGWELAARVSRDCWQLGFGYWAER